MERENAAKTNEIVERPIRSIEQFRERLVEEGATQYFDQVSRRLQRSRIKIREIDIEIVEEDGKP